MVREPFTLETVSDMFTFEIGVWVDATNFRHRPFQWDEHSGTCSVPFLNRRSALVPHFTRWNLSYFARQRLAKNTASAAKTRRPSTPGAMSLRIGAPSVSARRWAQFWPISIGSGCLTVGSSAFHF